MNFEAKYRYPGGELTYMPGNMNRSLLKRISWVLSCASAASLYIISFDDWKTNNFRIFIEVYALREYYVKEGYTLWRIKDIDPHSCYYLGKYPWHWDYEWGCPFPPTGGWVQLPTDKKIADLITSQKDEPWTGPRQGPYEGTTGGTGVRPDILENLDEDEFIFYQGKRKYGNYLAQLQFEDYLKNRLKNCIAQNYPPPGWKPKKKVKEAGAEWDWPGNPIKSLDPPTPMGRRAKPPGVEQTTVNVTMALYFSPADREDGLALDLEIS